MSSDDRDRLSFGEGPLGGPFPEPEPEEEEVRARPNRAFVFLAIAMGGLILLGILALIAALTFWLPAQKEARIAEVTQTVAAMTREAAAWTPTFTPSPTPVPPTSTVTPRPTETLVPTPTATRVVSDGPPAQATPTSTRPTSADWDSTTPPAGLGGFGTAAIAVGLAGLIFAVRKLRTPR
jgi:carbohydrate-binding DOMON domain-containing protein